MARSSSCARAPARGSAATCARARRASARPSRRPRCAPSACSRPRPAPLPPRPAAARQTKGKDLSPPSSGAHIVCVRGCSPPCMQQQLRPACSAPGPGKERLSCHEPKAGPAQLAEAGHCCVGQLLAACACTQALQGLPVCRFRDPACVRVTSAPRLSAPPPASSLGATSRATRPSYTLRAPSVFPSASCRSAAAKCSSRQPRSACSQVPQHCLSQTALRQTLCVIPSCHCLCSPSALGTCACYCGFNSCKAAGAARCTEWHDATPCSRARGLLPPPLARRRRLLHATVNTRTRPAAVTFSQLCPPP